MYDLTKATSPRRVIQRHLEHARDELTQRFGLEGEALDVTMRDTVRDVFADERDSEAPPGGRCCA